MIKGALLNYCAIFYILDIGLEGVGGGNMFYFVLGVRYDD